MRGTSEGTRKSTGSKQQQGGHSSGRGQGRSSNLSMEARREGGRHSHSGGQKKQK